MYQIETAVEGRPKAPDGSLCSAADWVSLQLRRETLERHVPRGSRVLEANPGAGHFTEILQQLECRVGGLASAPRDIDELERIPDAGFDAVVAFDGALSYALERRDRVLAEYRRLLRAGGVLVLDVLSLWGTLHRHLSLVIARDLVENRAVIRSGDVLGASPGCHLFRAAELEAFLLRGGFTLVSLSASSALSTGMAISIPSDPSAWSALLEYERAACAERGYLDGGSRLIAVARR